MTDRTQARLYWIATALTTAAFAVGGLVDLRGGDDLTAQLAHLGYPAHLATLLGAWKLLGAAAIAAPGLPRLKEWAYAGMLFDLTGAAVAHGAAGDPAAKVVTPLVLLAIALASWALRPASRRLGAVRLPTLAPAPATPATAAQPS
ncbi:MAG: DoxX family protein [Myxococcales bacterium]|nr:DoxX family protein [Myxococcales bacterium]